MSDLLIVVDLVNDFCSVGGVLAQSNITGQYYAASILGAASQKIEEYRTNKDPIIWLSDAHAEDDKEFDRFPKHAVKNTWGAEIVRELDPELAKSSSFELVIPKTRYSGFYGTDLEYQLSRIAPDVVTVIGVCTSICVMDTVGGLANRDYKVTVYRDCIADFDPEAHNAAISRMGGLYGAEII